MIADKTNESGEQARAREAGPDLDVFGEWVRRIAAGQTERYAAIGLPYKYNTIRRWADRNPELGEQLADAHETEVQRHLDTIDDAPDNVASGSEDSAGCHPVAATLKVKGAMWKLEKKDRKRFGQEKRVEQTIHQAPANDSPEAIAREACALLDRGQLVALVAELSEQIAAENDKLSADGDPT
jgi:hypothetical protein